MKGSSSNYWKEVVISAEGEGKKSPSTKEEGSEVSLTEQHMGKADIESFF